MLVTTTTNGALLLNGDGGFFYLPNLLFTGNDTFTYAVNDGTTQSNVATVTITVVASGGNTAPVAVNDSYTGAEDAQLDVAAATGVLANDTDAEGGPLTAVLLASVTQGTLTLRADGSFTYTPTAGFVGNDQFQYRARDGSGAMSAATTVTLAVNQTNDAPVAAADGYSTNENQTLNVNANNGVLDNDTDPEDDALTAVLVAGVSSGTLTLQPNGSFSFAPAAGFNGTVTFTYEANDGTLRSNAATVTLTVNAVNDPPTAQPETYTTAEETALAVTAANGVLANDTDPDSGTTLTAALIRNVANGSLTLRADGSFDYTPPSNFSGSTTFTYQARDGSAASATTTVTINVTAVNDAPFISNAPATTGTEGVTYHYTLTAADPDGNALQITAPTLPAWLKFNAPATISGTPAQTDAGTHDVAMEVSDGIAPAVVSALPDYRPSRRQRTDDHGDSATDGDRGRRVRLRPHEVRDGSGHRGRQHHVRVDERRASRHHAEQHRPIERHAAARRERRHVHRTVQSRGRDESGGGPAHADSHCRRAHRSLSHAERRAEPRAARRRGHMDDCDREPRRERRSTRRVAPSRIQRRRAVPIRPTHYGRLHDDDVGQSNRPDLHVGNAGRRSHRDHHADGPRQFRRRRVRPSNRRGDRQCARRGA